MKKLFATLFIVFLTCFAFAGCSGAPLPETEKGGEPEQRKIDRIYITIEGIKSEVALAENSSADALVEILKQGDIVYTANDYGGFEKVGNIGHSLPRNDTQITTQPGDVILYQGSNLCLYYGVNSWSFTRIGKIEGFSPDELKAWLGAGNGSVQITVGLS